MTPRNQKATAAASAAAGAAILATLAVVVTREGEIAGPPAPIVWSDASALAFTDAEGPHYGLTRKTLPGEAGVPHPGPIPPPAFPGTSPQNCTTARQNTKDATGWYCGPCVMLRCPPPIYSGPPPTVPCLRADLTQKKNGYLCREAIQGGLYYVGQVWGQL